MLSPCAKQVGSQIAGRSEQLQKLLPPPAVPARKESVGAIKAPWRPPGSGLRSATLGTASHGVGKIRCDGSSGSLRAVSLGRGVKAKGAFPHPSSRGAKLHASVAVEARSREGVVAESDRPTPEAATATRKRKPTEEGSQPGESSKRARRPAEGRKRGRELLAAAASGSKKAKTH